MPNIPPIEQPNIAATAAWCFLGFVMALAQPRTLHAEYGVVPIVEGSDTTPKPSGGSSLRSKPAAKDARSEDLLEETLRPLTPAPSFRSAADAPSVVAAGLQGEIYGLGEAPVAAVAKPAFKVPESLAENMPASFRGGGNSLKTAGDLSYQYNLLQDQPGVATSAQSSVRVMFGLLGVLALAAWFSFQITKGDPRSGPRRHRKIRPH